MNRKFATPIFATAALALAGCATTPGPIEVTRFVAADAGNQLGRGAISIINDPGEEDGLQLAPYKAAVAQELVRLGYSLNEGSSGQVAVVHVERHLQLAGPKPNPVSVGVGGATGSYGSGLGLGVGINLGGGPHNQITTQLSVRIRNGATGQSLWEGRADLAVKDNSPLADRSRNAQTLASALFRDFPGNNGETVKVRVK